MRYKLAESTVFLSVTSPALVKRTAGVEPAGKAEKAVAAKPKALVPWIQDRVRHEIAMRDQARAQGTTAKGLVKTQSAAIRV